MGFKINDGILKKYTEEKCVTEVVIPDGVQRIGERAFLNCDNITNVIIPDSVKSIGADAFKDCVSLESVIIPDTIIYISDSAFDGYDLAIFNHIKTASNAESQTDKKI